MSMTGELAVVGVLLEDECPPASSGRHRQQWCSALQQAMDLMPGETGAVSGGQRLLCRCPCLAPSCERAHVHTPSHLKLCAFDRLHDCWETMFGLRCQLPAATCLIVLPCRGTQPAPVHTVVAPARRWQQQQAHEQEARRPPSHPPPLVPAREVRRLTDDAAMHRGALLVRALPRLTCAPALG